MADPVHEPVDGLVLAGGKSSRFGSDKASAMLQGRSLLQWVVSALDPVCARIVIVRARGQQLPDLRSIAEIVEVEDRYEGLGPLAGLVTGFPHVVAPLCFATACDAPLLRPAVVHLLARLAAGHDLVYPWVGGFQQPLTAVYRPATCLPAFLDCVDRGLLKILPAFEGLDAVTVDEAVVREADPELESFRNANRPERLREIEELIALREPEV